MGMKIGVNLNLASNNCEFKIDILYTKKDVVVHCIFFLSYSDLWLSLIVLSSLSKCNVAKFWRN